MSKLDFIKTPKVDNVKLVENFVNARQGVNGTLHLTATHLIFVDPGGAKETWLLYSHIAEAEKLPISARGSSIRIRTKNFRNITFIIVRERECTDVFETIAHFSNPTKYEDLYAFHYNPTEEQLTQSAGWGLYEITVEYSRQGPPAELWARYNLNLDYKLCPTYPSLLYLPANLPMDVIMACAKFRSKCRLPVLSYYNKSSQAAICRCAQPLAGFNTRCTEDEQMLQAIIKSTPSTSRMYIVDTRPKINAMANRAAGKGYENMAHYENIDFHFIGIENIHVMRQSLQKLIEIFDTSKLSMSAYLKGLEDCGWLKHIKAVMDTSLFIAKAVMIEKRSVLVHCSDGWDRTAQTCSLAGILLDPYYRTIHGFQTLVEKEWLSFGHKFTERCGFLSGDPKEVSPIFTQFLESVWQLMNQFPTAFQFNERFLIEINTHLHSCQFGTFLGNCERERKALRLSERTYSLWGYMWQNLPEYINPFFQDGAHGMLQPSTLPQRFTFWKGLYNRHNDDVHPRDSIFDYVCSINDHNDSLRDHIRFLEKRIEELKGRSEKSKPGNSTAEDGQNENTENEKDIVDSAKKLSISNENSTNSTDDSCSTSDSNLLSNINPSSVDSCEVLSNFAVTWDQYRDVNQCSCGKAMESLSRKYNCWSCGKVYCNRCVSNSAILPAHYSGNKVPVCRPCYKKLKR